VTSSFLQEVANHKLFSYPIIHCYGISQDPITKNYVIVMDYINGGNMRQYLQSNYNNLSFKDKLSKLFHIAEGLKQIHEKGLVHRDLHSGNILNGGLIVGSMTDGTSYITDLGLCKPAHEVNDDQLFGVVSYLAPELLSKEEKKPVPYTYKSDIYSFGIIAYELLANSYPYYEKYIEG
jgi:serine/threonine protein kinase